MPHCMPRMQHAGVNWVIQKKAICIDLTCAKENDHEFGFFLSNMHVNVKQIILQFVLICVIFANRHVINIAWWKKQKEA